MAISQEQITQVAKLARLALSEAELAKYTSELDKILEYVQRLNQVDTSSVKPLTQTLETNESTLVRSDLVAESEFLVKFRKEFLDLAPQTEGRFIKVPKMGE